MHCAIVRIYLSLITEVEIFNVGALASPLVSSTTNLPADNEIPLT